VLCHPQSKNFLNKKTFNSKHVEPIKISCGTTKVAGADFHESSDFFPTYASWNSSLFETSVILTAWEHADQLIGDNDVAIMHTDEQLHYGAGETWKKLAKTLKEEPSSPIGLTIASSYQGIYDDWLIPENALFTPKHDPMKIHAFDNEVYVWDYIRKYDFEIYGWALDTMPRMIYSHQFCCTRRVFDSIGERLMSVARKLRLADIGFWTPHMFERLIALYLAKHGKPILTTAFWHYSSSGTFGPGELTLYGPRALKYYNINTKFNVRADTQALK
jgi:hypothetical protein